MQLKANNFYRADQKCILGNRCPFRCLYCFKNNGNFRNYGNIGRFLKAAQILKNKGLAC